MSDTESRWFKIIIALLSAIIVGITIANIVYFNRIRTGTCNAVNSGQATTMLWVNVILLIISIIVFIWSLWRLFLSGDTRRNIQHYMLSPEAGMQMGFAPTSVTSPSITTPSITSPTVFTQPPVAVTTSTAPSAIVTAPGEANVLAAQSQYF